MGQLVDYAEELLAETERKIRQVLPKSIKESQNEVKQILQDVIINQSIQEYYDSYTPETYSRSYSFYNIYTPIVTATNNSIKYDFDGGAENVPQHHSNSFYHQSGGSWISRYSNGFNFDSDANGMPESDWIFDNLLQGIHPLTHGIDGEYLYSPIYSTPLDELSNSHLKEAETQIVAVITNRLLHNLGQ